MEGGSKERQQHSIENRPLLRSAKRRSSGGLCEGVAGSFRSARDSERFSRGFIGGIIFLCLFILLGFLASKRVG